MILNRCDTEGILRSLIYDTDGDERIVALARYHNHTTTCVVCLGWLAKQEEVAEEWQWTLEMDKKLEEYYVERKGRG